MAQSCFSKPLGATDYLRDACLHQCNTWHKATVSWVSTVLSLNPHFASELCTVTQANCLMSLSWFPHPYCGLQIHALSHRVAVTVLLKCYPSVPWCWIQELVVI